MRTDSPTNNVRVWLKQFIRLDNLFLFFSHDMSWDSASVTAVCRHLRLFVEAWSLALRVTLSLPRPFMRETTRMFWQQSTANCVLGQVLQMLVFWYFHGLNASVNLRMLDWPLAGLHQPGWQGAM